jgi:hypothetical protein
MAKGKATPASFKPNDPRASAAGKKSSRALPAELKEARLINAGVFESTIYKYMMMPVDQLQIIAKDPLTPAVDLVVIKILVKAIQEGDHARLEFLFKRTIGNVVDKLDVRAAVVHKSLHQQIIDEIEGNNDDK